MSLRGKAFRLACAVIPTLVVSATMSACASSTSQVTPVPVPTPTMSGGGSPIVQPGSDWLGTMRSGTLHVYRGGTCSTDWTGSFRFTLTSNRASGSGMATLSSGPTCPFPLGQPQIRKYVFQVSGRQQGNTLLLSLSRFAQKGLGTIDYGGFALTIADRPAVVFRLALSGRTAHGSRTIHYVGPYGEDDSTSTNTMFATESPVA